jgi:hypothetical protein
MTRIIDLLFTHETLNKLEELFYTTFYCTTYTGYENVLTELSNIFCISGNSGRHFKNMFLDEVKDIYLMKANKHYEIDDDVMNSIIFHSVLNLFVDIIIIPTCFLFENKLKILNSHFIVPITGNINITNFIQADFNKINNIYGEDIHYKYGWNEYKKYIHDEMTQYFKFNSQGSILK